MRMKTAFLLLLALCLLIQATAAAEEETLTADMIPGRWTVDRVAWEDTVQPGWQTGIILLLTFSDDGTFIMDAAAGTASGTWEIRDGVLITEANGYTEEYRYTDGMLAKDIVEYGVPMVMYLSKNDTGEGSPITSEDITGHWTAAGILNEGKLYDAAEYGINVDLVFDPDGGCTLVIAGQEAYTLNWEILDGRLRVSEQGLGFPIGYDREKDMLFMDSSGMTLYLSKTSDAEGINAEDSAGK